MSYEGENLHRRASELFLQICEVEAPQRSSRIEHACGDDAALLREVRSLLEAHDRLTRFLEQPIAHEPLPRTPPTARPRHIGRYRVLELLGRGGMGVVYLAEQDHPRREVALKVLQPGLATPAHLRRFEHEAEILGRLQHPGIAQIFEAGSEISPEGVQPWFAMERVRGDSLIEYAERAGLSVRERLSLFTRICAAVQHAHQHGVVHRDLKPANILVDESGQPKILDFGIARAAETDARASSVLTARGELLGTLPYMSPEQIGGDPGQIDSRTDVYALGVIAYQLLSGRLPHDTAGRSMVEVARAIRETDPTSLGLQRRELSGDIETIVGKALEKEADRRYASAAELAADVERYLTHEPVLARPASTAYQLSKFARRNRVLVAGAAGTFLALVAGIVGTGWQAIRAMDQMEIAKQATDDAREQRNDALAAQHAAEREILRTKSALKFLDDMIASVDARRDGRNVKLLDVIQRATRDLETAFVDEPAIEASLRYTLSKAYRSLGLWEQSEAHARRALELFRRERGDFDVETLDAAGGLALVLMKRMRYQEAEPLVIEALAGIERLPGSTELDTMQQLTNLAQIRHALGDLDLASSLFEHCVAVRRGQLGDRHIDTSGSINALAVLRQEQGRTTEARALLEECMQIDQSLCEGETPHSLTVMSNLANVLRLQREWTPAKRMLEDLLERQRRVLGPDHPDCLSTMCALGLLHEDVGDLERADELLSQATDCYERTLGRAHPTTLTAINNLAVLYKKQGRMDEFERLFQVILETPLPEDVGQLPTVLELRNNLAFALGERGDFDKAEELFLEILSTAERSLPDQNWCVPVTEMWYADLLCKAQRFDEAEPLLLHAYPRLRSALGDDNWRTQSALRGLVLMYEGLKKPELVAEYRAIQAKHKRAEDSR